MHTDEYLVHPVGDNPALEGFLALTSVGRVLLPSTALTCWVQAQLFTVALENEQDMP